jgi:hypothetical protein
LAPETATEKAKGEREVAAGTMARRAAQDAEAPKKAADPVAGAQTAAPQAAPAAPPPATVLVAVRPVAPAAAAPGAGAGSGMNVALTATAPPPAAEGLFVLAAPFDLVVVSAPGGQVQWRVGPNGGIWRSADEGKTWYPQKSGVKSALLAAAAPSVNACWAVGAAGTVLLTDDGERWERRPFPETTDLVMVDARSSHEAIVTTRDGRRFVTVNRGATWTPERKAP